MEQSLTSISKSLININAAVWYKNNKDFLFDVVVEDHKRFF
ncbi:hypothetical protein OH685_09205 [Acinetobacter pittii]|nr:hypothetical protein OH685_09205 [Acinetobacter pittii]